MPPPDTDTDTDTDTDGGLGAVTNRLGPYEHWMFDIGKVFDLPDLMLHDTAHLSAVAEFSTPVQVDDLAGLSSTAQPAGQHWIRLPALYRHPDFSTRFVPFMVSPVHAAAGGARLLGLNASAVQDFAANFGPGQALPPGATGHFRFNLPIRDEAVDRTLPQDPVAPPPDPALLGVPPSVILAIIDLGIPLAHAAFRHAAGTRIDFAWAQSAPAKTTGEVLFGREYRREDINALVQTHKGDEDAIYDAMGLLSRPNSPPMPLSRLASHGAHCLDLMAGHWPGDSAAKARIIAVDLPSSSVWETSGFGKDMFLLSAFHYIFSRADLIRQSYGCPDLPLVINLSYGHSGGPHDGTTLIEVAMAELLAFRNALAPTTLVMPAANLFLDRLYAQVIDRHFTADPADPTLKQARLQWFAPPDDRTSSFLEVWFPPGFKAADIRLDVTPPGGHPPLSTDLLAKGSPDMVARPIMVGGKLVGQLSIDRHRGSRWRVMIALSPTETFATPAQLTVGPDQYGTAPAGLWTLTFRLPLARTLPEVTASGANGGIQARIQHDTSFGQGNTGARQSHFIDPADLPYGADGAPAQADQPAAMLRRFGSLNGMATGAGTLVVGGQVLFSGKSARYASAGPARADSPHAPFGKPVALSAPTERSHTRPGMQAAGTRSGVWVAASGTSSASPQVARLLAASQITTPLPPGATLAQVLQRLTTLPEATAVPLPAPPIPGTDPKGRQRLGTHVLYSGGQPDT